MNAKRKKEIINLQLRKLRVIISGGGTGGHIFPGLAIAGELKRLNPQNEILWVGANGRMEMKKVPDAGYRIIGLPISGLQRKLSFSNLLVPFKLIKSVLQSLRIITNFKPQVAVGVGGYASGPLLFAASLRKIPCLIQEQNSYAGMTNKWLAKRAQRICVAYEGMEKYFPQSRIVLTGNPVRKDLTELISKQEEAFRFFNFSRNKKCLLVLGGSLGARTINKSIAKGIAELAKNNFQVIWQTGKNFYPEAKEIEKTINNPSIYITEFIARMDLAYACAEVVVSRAGASSISELQNAGLPCILVPSPNVAEDHQAKNAMALVSKNAALLVSDADAESLLVETAIRLMNNHDTKRVLAKEIHKLSKPDAAEQIVKEIYSIAGTA